MTMFQTILLFAVLAIWLCISAEYHENRMKLLEK